MQYRISQGQRTARFGSLAGVWMNPHQDMMHDAWCTACDAVGQMQRMTRGMHPSMGLGLGSGLVHAVRRGAVRCASGSKGGLHLLDHAQPLGHRDRYDTPKERGVELLVRVMRGREREVEC